MDTDCRSQNDYVKLLYRLTAIIGQSLQDAPIGSLKVNHVRGSVQFCQRMPGSGKCRHLSAEEYGEAVKLAQKDYDLMVLKLLKAKLKETEEYTDENVVRFHDRFAIRFFTGGLYRQLDGIFDTMVPERQAMVEPVVPLTRDFVQDWLAEPYEGKGFRPDDVTAYYTGKDVRVRSKSELYIANKLDEIGVPNKYECPLFLRDKILYPDFTILDVCTRELKYLEHCGMMDDPDYVDAFLWKMDFYQANDIYPGEDLILTFESGRRPMNTRTIDRIIRRYFYIDRESGPKT